MCVLVHARTHTQTNWVNIGVEVLDGHLEGQKNPDQLKRSIHVDRIGVHSTFVYIYVGLRVLMIWANCLFSLNMSFLLRKVEDVTTISKSVSHFGEHKRLGLESSKRNYYIISFSSNNKSNPHSCVCGLGLEVGGFSSLFMVSACCWRGRLCFDRGRDSGFVLCIPTFLQL